MNMYILRGKKAQIHFEIIWVTYYIPIMVIYEEEYLFLILKKKVYLTNYYV